MTVLAKMFFQSLWYRNISDEPESKTVDWDDALPSSLLSEWNSVFNELYAANTISIPRWIFHKPEFYVEVHGFGDALSKAIAATVYLRIITADQVKSNLLVAKTKLAPVKTVSIARLELCAAVLLTKLTHHIVKTLPLEHCSIYLWSDSKDALAWIVSLPHL